MHSEQAHDAVIPEAPPAGRSGVSVRLRGLLVGGPCLVLLVLAVLLRPSASGVGTHEQLGLGQCSFLARTGWPCPTCGMTTAFAHMARGRVWPALHAQPFGAVLFLVVAAMGIIGAAELATGKDLLRYLHPGAWWVWVGVGGVLAGWAAKAAIGCASGQFPMK
jgi:hypothetical protein